MVWLPVQDAQGNVIGRMILSEQYQDAMREEVVVLGGIFNPNKGGLLGYTLQAFPTTEGVKGGRRTSILPA